MGIGKGSFVVDLCVVVMDHGKWDMEESCIVVLGVVRFPSLMCEGCVGRKTLLGGLKTMPIMRHQCRDLLSRRIAGGRVFKTYPASGVCRAR